MEKQVKFLLVVTIIAISIFGLIAFSQMSGLSIFNFTKIKAGISGYNVGTQSIGVSSCRDLNDSNTEYNLSQDISSAGRTCLNVTANNVTLDCQGHSISGNNDPTTAGIKVEGFNNITIKNCTIYNFGGGISFTNSNFSNLSYNALNNNIGNGIYLESGFFNDIDRNTAVNNSGTGIRLSYSKNNTLKENSLFNNSVGFYIGYASMDNIVVSNTVHGQWQQRGIQMDNSHNNTIYNNFFNSTLNAYDPSSINYWNTSYTCALGPNILGGTCIGGNYWSDYTGMDNVGGDGIGDTLLPYNASGNIKSGGDYLPLILPSAGSSLSCGTTISSSVLLNSDMNCNVTAMTIVANNVVLDCDGHTITGNGSGYGVYLGDSLNATVKNCKIKGFGYAGISVGTGSFVSTNATIINNVISNITSSGVSSAEAYGNSISSNTISNVRYGVSLIWSLNTKVFGNTIENCTDSGIEAGSDGNSGTNITENYITNASNGMYLAFDTFIVKNNIIDKSRINGLKSDENILKFYNNTIQNSGVNGIYLSSPFAGTQEFINNTITSSGTGINVSTRLTLSNDMFLITGNNITSNNYGFYAINSSNNTIYNNYFSNTNNAYDNGLSFWNTTKTPGTNIVGGSFIAGNYWNDYAGVDNVGTDGIGDTLLPYNASNSIIYGGDYAPLVYAAAGEQVITTTTGGGARTYIPTESEFSVGYSHSMRAGDRLRFTLGTTTHYLEIERVRNGVVTISISSNPIIFNLTAGESKKIDIDADGVYDILVKAESVSYSSAQIFIQRISEAVSAVPLACSNGCSTYGQKECSSDSLSYRTCGNYDSDTCFEWSSWTSCASGQVCSAGNCILQTLTCSGTEPYGTGVIEGQDNYASGYMPTSWTYDSSATSSTPCEWKCDAGYVQNGDACQKKTSVLIYVFAGIIILALAAGIILLARYYSRRKQLRGEILTQKARAFVRDARSRGYSEQAIEQMLLDKGWTEEDIKGCLKDGVKCKFERKKKF